MPASYTEIGVDARHRRYAKFDAISRKAKIDTLRECVKICEVVKTAEEVKRLLEMELMYETTRSPQSR